jgi:hypothetical protein
LIKEKRIIYKFILLIPKFLDYFKICFVVFSGKWKSSVYPLYFEGRRKRRRASISPIALVCRASEWAGCCEQ